MARIREMAERRTEVYWMKSSDVVVQAGWNARKDYGDLDELKESIVANGIREPLKGYQDEIDGETKLILTNRHRRFAATQKAESEGHEILIPVLLETKYSNDTDYLITQIVSNDGKPLTTLEQAEVFKRLLDHGWDESKIASKTGKNRATVINYLSLLSQPIEVVQMVEKEQVSPTLALSVSREHGADAPEILQQSVELAQSEGKDKATAKHVAAVESGDAVASRKPNLKKLVKSIAESAPTHHMAEGVTITLSIQQYSDLMAAIGLQKPEDFATEKDEPEEVLLTSLEVGTENEPEEVLLT